MSVAALNTMVFNALGPAERIRGVKADCIYMDEYADMSPDIFEELTKEPAFPMREGYVVHQLCKALWEGDGDAGPVLADWLEERGDRRYLKVRRRISRAARMKRFLARAERGFRDSYQEYAALREIIRTLDEDTTDGDLEALFDLAPERLKTQVRQEIALQVCAVFAELRPWVKQARWWVVAADHLNTFTRQRLREESFYRRIMPPLQITNDELDRAVPTDRPYTLHDPPLPSGITRRTFREVCELLPRLAARREMRTVFMRPEELAILAADEEVGR